MLVELLILVLIVVPQSRKITKNSGGSGKATGTFAIEELLVCEAAFDNHAIVLIPYVKQLISAVRCWMPE